VHVLTVIDHIYPDVTGGAYIWAYEVARRMRRRGYRISALVAKPEPGFPSREEVDGIEVYRFDRTGPRHHPRSFASRVLGARRLFREIHREAPVDLIHFQAPLCAVGVLLAPECRRLPRLATIQGPGHGHEYMCEARFTRAGRGSPAPGAGQMRECRPRLQDYLYYAAITPVEGWYIRRCDRVLSLSDYCLESFLATHRMDRSRTALLPGGVDTERFHPGSREAARQALGWPAQGLVLFTLRRLTSRMGIENLIDAMAEVHRAVPGVSLVIGGDGPLREALIRQIADRGLQGVVRLAGRVPDEQLCTYYQAADLFVLPTAAAEGFGLVTVEALACNVPAFGTPVGGTVEVLRRVNPELLFEDATPAAMARKIVAFCREPERFQGSYRRDVERLYSWDTLLDSLERHYAALCPGSWVPASDRMGAVGLAGDPRRSSESPERTRGGAGRGMAGKHDAVARPLASGDARRGMLDD
jgi:glycosyltransferase involved in cell wall biosynthesis